MTSSRATTAWSWSTSSSAATSPWSWRPRRSRRAAGVGLMLELYALRSQGSWGIGDLGDLREFVGWTGREHGAEVVLLNPLHAITPVPPVQASPYTPSSRRFATPLALRVTDLDAYRSATTRHAARWTRCAGHRRQPDRARPGVGGQAVGLRTAVELGRRPEPAGAPTSCGSSPSSAPWPSCRGAGGPVAEGWAPGGPGRRPRSASSGLAGVVPAGLQDQVQRQLANVHAVGQEVGVRVCTTSRSAATWRGGDGWALQDVLAMGVHVGAPRRTRSASRARNGACLRPSPGRDATGDAGGPGRPPATDRSLRDADGMRIDHVAGLWRLWWVPPGESPFGAPTRTTTLKVSTPRWCSRWRRGGSMRW